jgi:hypothetical protein
VSWGRGSRPAGDKKTNTKWGTAYLNLKCIRESRRPCVKTTTHTLTDDVVRWHAAPLACLLQVDPADYASLGVLVQGTQAQVAELLQRADRCELLCRSMCVTISRQFMCVTISSRLSDDGVRRLRTSIWTPMWLPCHVLTHLLKSCPPDPGGSRHTPSSTSAAHIDSSDARYTSQHLNRSYCS